MPFGTSCISLLDGIFAFAIWNIHTQELFIGRDRMGIKPLYYTEAGLQFSFASEMKVLLRNPEIPREIDLQSLNEYLSFEYVPTPGTIIKNIYRLKPGHFLLYTRKGLSVTQYWNPSLIQSETYPPVHWKDYASTLYETIRASVKKELLSDVPIGVLLSGGLDSSVIAAFMAKESSQKIDSFSIGFEEESFNELPFARLVSKHLNTNHHELTISSTMAVDAMSEITNYLDEPFGDSSFIPTFLLARFARQKVKVVLGGDGGDEMFAGYPTLMAHRLIEYYEKIVPRYFRSVIIPELIKSMPVSFNDISLDFRIRRILSGRGVPLLDRHHRWLGSL